MSTRPQIMREKYLHDPVKYCYEILHVQHLTPVQVKILEEYANNPRCRILIPSGNNLGKSFIAACIMSHHHDCNKPAWTFSTAPSQAQVKDILFRQLRLLRKGDPKFAPRDTVLFDSEDHVMKGFTATSDTSFQGRHEGAVLMIFDEAEDIHPDFFTAAETFAHRIICFYNPTTTDSHMAFEERRGGWTVVRMNALEHPNVLRGAQGQQPLIPNAVTIEQTIAQLTKWSLVLPPDEPPLPGDVELCGVRYRPGPMAQARVLGIRPTKANNAVFDSNMLHDMCTERHSPKGLVQIGCDVARFGDDFSSMHVRRGMCSLHHEAHNGWNGSQVARRLRELCCTFASDSPRDVAVVIDDTGQRGGSIIDQAQGFRFLACNVGLPPTDNEKEYYPNTRCQLYFDFEDMVKKGMVDMSRIDKQSTHDIIEQFLASGYTMDGKGRRVLDRKQDTKDKLARSPDDADAVVLAYYQYPETLEVS